MLELYNLSSKLQKESKSEDTERMVMKLNQSVTPLPEFFFTSKAKLITSDDEDGQTRTSVRQNSEDGGVTDQLEACGYEVVPDVFEVAGDTWELIDKVTRKKPSTTSCADNRLAAAASHAHSVSTGRPE
jgi:hypothetical protein